MGIRTKNLNQKNHNTYRGGFLPPFFYALNRNLYNYKINKNINIYLTVKK